MTRELEIPDLNDLAGLSSSRLPIDTIATPSVLIDLDRMDRNIARWSEHARAHGVKLRPHAKTHKSPTIARLQLAAGASGIAVAKVAEAEVFVAHGIRDIVIAYSVYGQEKWARIARLAANARIAVNADNAAAIHGLDHAARSAGVSIGVYLDIDTGMGRGGISHHEPDEVVNLARLIDSLANVSFEGVTTHRGMFFPGAETMSVADAGHQEGELLVALAERLRAQGLSVPAITGGGTITGRAFAEVDGVTEVRAGTCVFYDLMQVGYDSGPETEDDIAISVLATVVSSRSSGRCVIDAGSKTFSGDRAAAGSTAGSGFTDVAKAVGRDVTVNRITEEHGMAMVREGERIAVGDRLRFYPFHACTCVNLSDELYGIRGETVEMIIPVAARGKRT